MGKAAWIQYAALVSVVVVLTGCPARRGAGDDPGPPSVLNPTLLDRG